jgi:quercetin dioxygenase-like cupin family protein
VLAKYDDFMARRVVTGYTADGRSTVSEDGPTPARLVGPGNTKCDVWRFDNLPATIDSGDGLDVGVVTHPPERGLVHRVVSVPPDAAWDPTVGYGDANGPLAGSVSADDAGGIPGMHWTPTVDLVTVVSGELVCILEDGEVTLGPGDTIVQNGTLHAWRNRKDHPAIIVSVMVACRR